MRKFLNPVLVFLLLLLSSTAAHSQRKNNNIDKADEAFGKGDYKTAAAYYSRALSSATGEERYYLFISRADCYFQLTDFENAMNDYEAAIKLYPDSTFAYLSRAMNVYDLDLDMSIADFTVVLSKDPNNTYALYGRGNCYRLKKDYKKAMADIDRAILVTKTYVDVYSARAMIYTETGRYENAVADIKTLLKLDEKEKRNTRFFVNILEPLARLHRFDEALDYYSYFDRPEVAQVQDETMQFFTIDLKMVLQYFSSKDYEMAAQALEGIQKQYSSDSTESFMFQSKSYSLLLSLRGYALENLGKPEEAEQAYKMALLIREAQPEVKEGLDRLKAKTRAIAIQEDKEDPVLKILEPAPKRSISIDDDKPASLQQKVRGQAIDKSGIKAVKVNNQPVKVEDNGYFETLVTLAPGKNSISILAVDNAANSTATTIDVEAAKAAGATAPPVTTAVPELGNTPVYHAILIAESEYKDKDISSLPGPLSDMEMIADLLVAGYTFEPSRVTRLTNASKTTILETIMKVSNELKENDNLFIFYAGHGQMVKRPDGKEEGYIVPSDATKGAISTYIRGDDMFRSFEFSKARHILVVADACFAGSLFRDMGAEAEASVTEAYKDQSRKVLASGNRTVVPDESKFIAFLKTALLNNKKKYITAEQLLNSFKEAYVNETRLSLQYYPIAGVDLGGQFVFIRK